MTMPGLPGSTWKVAAVSAQGRRSRNEDRVLARIIPGGRDAAVIAVADGMGGHEAGNVAAELAMRGLSKALRRLDPKSVLDPTWHQWIYDDINHRVRRTAGRIDKDGMGTTLASVLANSDGVFISHVGDSRAYRVDPFCMARLTRDHSVAEDAVRRGIMDGAEARGYGFGHALLRAIGTDETVEAEFSIENPLTAEEGGRVYLVCSDGLWNVLEDEEIERIVRRTPSVEEAANALVGAALAAGSDDNVSVALLEIGSLPRSPVPLHLPPGPNPGATLRYRPPAKAPRARRRKYALIAAGIALGVVVGWTLLGRPTRPAGPEAPPAATLSEEAPEALDPGPPPGLPRILWLAVEGAQAEIIYRGRTLGTASPGSPVELSVFVGDTIILVPVHASGRGTRQSVVIQEDSPDTLRWRFAAPNFPGGGDG
jgi:PPM family protein phosphatase